MLKHLEWLVPAPQDFQQRLRAVEASGGARRSPGIGGQLMTLGSFRLDANQLAMLADCARELIVSATDVTPLTRVRLGVLGGGTLDLAAEAIVGSALRHQLLLDVVLGEYGAAMQEALDPQASLRQEKLDMLLIAPDPHMLGLDHPVATEEAAEQMLDSAMQHLNTIIAAFRDNAPGGILVQTLVPPVEPLFGSFDIAEPGSTYSLVSALNVRIAAMAKARSVVCVDVARAAHWIGLDHWNDPGHWHAAKLPFSPDALPLYGDVVSRTLAAMKGKSRKCLVLDLDNTLWGGVIGDDGLEGISLGQGSGTGEAFLAIQRMALELRARGILLAICSKNEESAARLPFSKHPEMLIKEDHVAAFQANWTDKASNLREIARQLNIGIDALVFLDDNPAERDIIRRELPMVAVPELPGDPALYPRALACAGYFEAVSVVDEDRRRAESYKANVERQVLASTSDMESYLNALQMECTIEPFHAVGRSRITQLINKSNQFNLTTRRYTESEVAFIERDPEKYAVQVRLRDKFGDNGMISVVIFDKLGALWSADTWLMSCRVLGRRIEEAVLANVAEAAIRAGAGSLEGRFVPTDKNRMVANHYEKLGFALVSGSADEGSIWRLDLSTYVAATLPMRITFSTDASAPG